MHGHVTLISCSPEAAAIIASGGRISTMDGTADEIYAKSLAAGSWNRRVIRCSSAASRSPRSRT